MIKSQMKKKIVKMEEIKHNSLLDYAFCLFHKRKPFAICDKENT